MNSPKLYKCNSNAQARRIGTKVDNKNSKITSFKSIKTLATSLLTRNVTRASRSAELSIVGVNEKLNKKNALAISNLYINLKAL
ncbi:Receptor L domain [Moritella viscosa]|nr:Receptor L domain [Moritella viscosa]